MGRGLLHITFSTVAVLLILLLVWFFRRKSGLFTILLSSLAAAFLVPTISMYALFVSYGLFKLEFDSVIKVMPLALIAGMVSWPFWVPLGIINSALFFAYTRKLKNNGIISDK